MPNLTTFFDKKPLIYRISFDGTDRFYIGSTVNFKQRKNRHLRDLRSGKHDNSHVQNVYNMNPDAIYFDVIFLCEKPEELKKAEDVFIKTFWGQERFLNKAIDANGYPRGELHPLWGKKHSEEIKEKIRQKHIGMKHSAETRALISRVQKGRPCPLKSIEKMKELFTGVPKSEEHRRKIAEANRRKAQDPVYRQKLKDSWIKRKMCVQQREV